MHGSTKCSCRWSTYSVTRPSRLPGHRHVVEHRQVLHELAQTDAARVRAHRHAELLRHEVDRQDLVHAPEPCRVELAVVERPGLEHLLEEHAVHPVLAAGDADRSDRRTDRGVTEHVVGAGGLLDPERLEPRQRVDPLDRLRHIPDLVRVDHQRRVRADHLARDGQAADVVVEVGADLELDVPVAGVDRLLAEPPQLVVGVAEPAGARRVARVSPRRRARRSAPNGSARVRASMPIASSRVSASDR